MKNIMKLSTGGMMLTALIAAIGFAPSARAQLFSYEATSFDGLHHAGDVFSGQFRINLQNFDMGTLYPSLGAPGNAAGYGQNGTGTQTIAGGQTTLNGIQSVGATGAVGAEDSWGIARIVTVTDLDGNVVWSEPVKHAQLTVMFYGEQDFYVNQLANGFQEVNGSGMHVDLYLQNYSDSGYTPYNPLAGSAGRTGSNGYATATDGSLILSTVSTPDFIHDAGTLGGLATEFASVFNDTSGGSGQAYLSVTGGTYAPQFDRNFFDSPYVPGVTADLYAQFTTNINTSTGDWLVRSNDPVTGDFVAVPEPSTYGLIGAAMLSGIIALRRRAQRILSV